MTFLGLYTLLLAGLGIGLLLLFVVRLEREGVRMDRASAEATARRDTDEEPSGNEGTNEGR